MLYNKEIFHRCFHYSKKYWYENIKCIPEYFSCIKHLTKYGYDKYALWNTDDWFIDTMRSILQRYKKDHRGVPIVIDNYPMDNSDDKESQKLIVLNDKKWDEIIDRMIELLNLMDSKNPRYAKKYEGEHYRFDIDVVIRDRNDMDKAKDEFFELFSRYFWCLWD